MIKTQPQIFAKVVIALMCILFMINFFVSKDCNLFWVALSGGGKLVGILAESSETVFENHEFYRLVTYGYFHPAVWHLLANILGLWYIEGILEKEIGWLQFILVYHVGLVVAGILFLFIFPSRWVFGASPAIFAGIGVVTNRIYRNRVLWEEYKSQKGFNYLLYYFVLSNFIGIGTLLIHFLGFVTGFLLAFFVKDKKEKKSFKRKIGN